jgi:type IV pilus assembly protein PilA
MPGFWHATCFVLPRMGCTYPCILSTNPKPLGDVPMKKMQQGFTLIELMIVIAIIAILAAIALPAYQDYTIRAKVSETNVAMSAAKLAVAETAQSQGILATAVASNTTAGYDSPSTNLIKGVTIANGVITGETQNTGAKVDPVLVLTPTQTDKDAPITWACTFKGGVAKHVPASCRTAGASGT